MKFYKRTVAFKDMLTCDRNYQHEISLRTENHRKASEAKKFDIR